MTAYEILNELVRIDPAFRAHWDGDNLFRDDDGSFTACGVFSQFTDFFREHHERMKTEQLTAIGVFLKQAEVDQVFAEAAYTCFLENIAGDPSDQTLAPYLPPAALAFMSHWRPPA